MEKTFTYLTRLSILASCFITTTYLYAADFYWINGSGNWNESSHWSYISGGSSCGTIPGANDHVIFDENSFSAFYAAVYLTDNTTLSTFSVTSTKKPAFYGENKTLTITNALKLEKQAHFDFGD